MVKGDYIMLAKEQAQELRQTLKKLGYSSKQVSVTSRRSGYSTAIDVTIKDLSIPMKVVNEAAGKYEKIDREEGTGEILLGGNNYVDVSFDYEVLSAARDLKLDEARAIMERHKDLRAGIGATIFEDGLIDVVYYPHWDGGCGRKIRILKKPENHKELKCYALETLEICEAHNEYAIAEFLVLYENKQFVTSNKSKYEEAGRKAFCGLLNEDILKKAFPDGCTCQDAIDYFIEHGEELEALGLIN